METDHEIMSQHLINSKETNDEAASLVQQEPLRSSFSSSKSSTDSRSIEKDVSDPLLEPTQTNLESEDVSDFNPRLSMNDSSVLYPSDTMMVQGPGYDPNRIPASVFTSKPATPMDWSVASNESLFSIHMGNNSFSRDHVFLIYKSNEFPEINNPASSLFPVSEAGNVEKVREETSKESKLTGQYFPEAARGEHEFPFSTMKGVSKETKTPKNLNLERISHAEEVRNSTSSAQSFHFPILDATVGGSNSAKLIMDNPPSKKHLRHDPLALIRGPGTPKRPMRSWFSCLSCCSLGFLRKRV